MGIGGPGTALQRDPGPVDEWAQCCTPKVPPASQSHETPDPVSFSLTMDGALRIGFLCRWVVVFAVLAFSVLAVAVVADRSQAADSPHRNASDRSAAAAGSSISTRAGAEASQHAHVSCFAQAAVAGSSLRFSTVPGGANGIVSLTIHRYAKPVLLSQTPSCASSAAIGHTYRASLRYSSTTSAVGLEVLVEKGGKWHESYLAEKLKRQTSLVSTSTLIGPVQPGIQRLALGVVVRATGTVRVSSFSLVDASEHPTATTPVSSTAGVPAPALVPAATGPVVSQEAIPSRCDQIAPEEAPAEKTTVTPPAGSPEVDGKWEVLNGEDHARTIHSVLLQNGKLLLMAGSGNSRMEFDAGCFRSYIYNPAANTWKEIPTPTDLFCAGHVQLANGNVLILGGTKAYPAPPEEGKFPSTIYDGENASWIFNIASEQYEKVKYNEAEPHQPKEPGPLLSGAWYPSATELGNGDVISFGGLNEEGNGTTDTNYFIGPYNKEDSEHDPPGEWVGWGSPLLQQTYDWYWGLYPSMILTADGRLFYDGSHVFGNGIETKRGYEGATPAPEGSAIYDFYCRPNLTEKEREESQAEQLNANAAAEIEGPVVAGGPKSEYKTHPRVQNTPGLLHPDERDQSASLLLPPAQSQKVMIMGGGNTYNTETPATRSTQEINLEATDPKWESGPELPQGTMDNGEEEKTAMGSMAAGKMYVSAVALPNGKVLETGGSALPRTKDVHEAAMFNPEKNEFEPVAADPVGRDYHSEALLLPDGRVMALGSNPVNVGLGTEGFETRISIYSPPYLFMHSARPTINSIDETINKLEGNVNKTSQWNYGSANTIEYSTKGSSSSEQITSAVLIRPAAVTHSSDPNQREVALPITTGGGTGSTGANRTLEVSLASNPNLAPPGYYMVFLVNREGVPSVAQWVHVGPQGNPDG